MVIRAVSLLMSLVGLSAVLGWSTSARAGAGKIVVVVASNSPIGNISAAELKQLFLAKRSQLSKGGKAVLFTPKAGTRSRVAFDQAVLDLGPQEAARYWIDRMIRGMSAKPRALPNARTLMQVISKVPGAIGYVFAKDLDAGLGVKAITIDGKHHTDPRYVLADD